MKAESKGPSLTKLNWTMAALFVSIFLTQLDQTIVSTALPTIVSQLDGLNQMSWVFTVYMLTSTVMMPIGGKLSDLFGRKRFYMIGLILFLLGSVLCGLAQSMTQLILYRGIQGLGAGFLIPVTYTLVFTLMPKERAGIYQSLYMGVFAVSSIVGPSLGAFITEHLNWRWNFYINLPFGLFVFLVLNKLLQPSTQPERKPSVDGAGALLLAAATLSVLLGLKMGGVDYAWRSWQIAGLLTLGMLCLLGFLRVEAKAREPIIPLSLFRSRIISGTLAATFLQGMMMYGSLVYIPLFVQGSMGGDVADAGSALTPLMFSVMAGAVVSNPMIKRWSWRLCILLAMLIAGIGVLGMTQVTLEAGPWTLKLLMLLIGLGIGIMMTVGQMAVTFSAEERIKGVATSSVGFFRSVGGVFGTALMAAVVNNRLHGWLAGSEMTKTEGVSLNPQVLLQSGGGGDSGTHQLIKEALTSAVHAGFWLLAAASLLGIGAAWWTSAGRFRAAEVSSEIAIPSGKETKEGKRGSESLIS